MVIETDTSLFYSFVHVCESDAWLSSLTLHIATCRSISSLTVSNLPPRTRAHMVDPITNLPDIEGICDVAEWCLSLVAWRVGLKHVTINDLPIRMMDRVGFSLLTCDDDDSEGKDTGFGFGKLLSEWEQSCLTLLRMKTN